MFRFNIGFFYRVFALVLGAFCEGSRAYVDFDTAEVLGIAGSGIHQREECGAYCAGVRRA